MELKIEYVNIDELKPYINNAKIHTAEQIAQIKKSIKEFGFNDPIAIDKNNMIIEGHGRHIACKELGIKTVPIIRLDDLTEEQRKAYTLIHNKLTMNSGFDVDLLQAELNEIINIDMNDFGFDLNMNFDEYSEDKKIVEDEIPEEVTTRCKLGDLYKLGDHRLICGDATDIEVVKRLMNGKKAKLLLTDPPYGINAVKVNKVGGGGQLHFKGVVGYGEAGKNKIVDCTEYRPILGDESTETANASYEVAIQFSDDQIIFGGNYFTDFLRPSRCWIVWDKQNTGNFADAELAWTSFDKGVKLYQFLWNGLCRAGSRAIEGKTRVHPTQKPVGMIADILKDFSKAQDTILDLFGGSGSTLIACEQLNRKCYMSELDPYYCDVIIDRWEKLTGKKAKKIED